MQRKKVEEKKPQELNLVDIKRFYQEVVRLSHDENHPYHSMIRMITNNFILFLSDSKHSHLQNILAVQINTLVKQKLLPEALTETAIKIINDIKSKIITAKTAANFISELKQLQSTPKNSTQSVSNLLMQTGHIFGTAVVNQDQEAKSINLAIHENIIDRDHINNLMTRAMSYRSDGEYAEAVTLFEKALALIENIHLNDRTFFDTRNRLQIEAGLASCWLRLAEQQPNIVSYDKSVNYAKNALQIINNTPVRLQNNFTEEVWVEACTTLILALNNIAYLSVSQQDNTYSIKLFNEVNNLIVGFHERSNTEEHQDIFIINCRCLADLYMREARSAEESKESKLEKVIVSLRKAVNILNHIPEKSRSYDDHSKLLTLYQLLSRALIDESINLAKEKRLSESSALVYQQKDLMMKMTELLSALQQQDMQRLFKPTHTEKKPNQDPKKRPADQVNSPQPPKKG